jgi:hypothetical protein
MKQVEMLCSATRWWDSNMTPGAEITVYIKDTVVTAGLNYNQYGAFMCKDFSNSDSKHLLTIFREATTKKQIRWIFL